MYDLRSVCTCTYALGTRLVWDFLPFYKPINLPISWPALSLLQHAVSPGSVNLKEMEIKNQIGLSRFLGCIKHTHKYQAVHFLFSELFSLTSYGSTDLPWESGKGCVCQPLLSLRRMRLVCPRFKLSFSAALNFSAAPSLGKRGTSNPAVWEGPSAFWTVTCGRAGAVPAPAFVHVRLPGTRPATQRACRLAAGQRLPGRRAA